MNKPVDYRKWADSVLRDIEEGLATLPEEQRAPYVAQLADRESFIEFIAESLLSKWGGSHPPVLGPAEMALLTEVKAELEAAGYTFTEAGAVQEAA